MARRHPQRTFKNVGMADTWVMLFSLMSAITTAVGFDDLLGFERLCNHPEKIDHGNVEVWGNGWLVTFTCDPGYQPIGEVLGACNLKTGRWTINPPFCVAKGCSRSNMMYVRNGRAHFLHGGAVVRFSCSPGYYLVGSTHMHCTGRLWSGRKPDCKAVHDDNRSNTLNFRDRLGRPSARKWEQIKNNLTSIRESDDTCMSRSYKVKVPKIPNSKSKIIYLKGHRKKYEWIPVVTYTCQPGYRLENENNRHLYCKYYRYDAAIFPNCIPEINPCEVDNGNATCHQICKPNDTKYTCHCSRGYTIDKDAISCNDIDECNTNRGICGQNGCQNTVGSYICMCARPGYRKINNKCLDVDECASAGRNPCPGPCINLPGTYACNCSIPGYQPTPNLQFCGDVDECLGNNGGCEDVCVNTRGSYKCRCEKAGFKLAEDKKHCEDIDECKRYKSICNLGGHCFNNVGSFVCECGEGFSVTSDRAHCKDSNECRKNNGGCQQICVNTPGTFHCACRDGFHLENKTSCSDINECQADNGGCEDRCLNRIGSFRCVCLKRGYIIGKDGKSCQICPKNTYYRGRRRTGHCVDCPANSHTDGPGKKFKRNCKCDYGFRGIPALNVECQDIDECENNNFGCAFGCENTPGSAHCTCPEGYELVADGKNCDDLNECKINNGGCEDQCINEKGFSRCECLQPGFILAEDERGCEDIDECLADNFNCSDICTNTQGSAHCNCSEGYYLSGDGKTCLDIDECSVQSAICEDTCLNIPGSFHCECTVPGYRLNSDKRSCEDINECFEQSGLCEDTCRNTKGSYLCLCRNSGFVLDSDGRSCMDIDECTTEQKNLCQHICLNTHGSFRCSCKPGYFLKDSKFCEECPKNSYGSGNTTECTTCPMYSHTSDTKHQSREDCKCNVGFWGNLNETEDCQDLDECEQGLMKCSHICVNIVGSAYCGCPQGYELLSDQKTCKDRDECSYKNGQCEHTCVNTPGAYWCKCHQGYEANPYQTFRCQDTDECRKENGGCSHICVNTRGSFYCTCPRSWFMTSNRKTCEERFCYILAIPTFGDMWPRECSTPRGPGVTVDTTCYFSCPKAYKLVGSTQRKCLSNGQWSGGHSHCAAKQCPKLDKYKNGLIFPKRCTRWKSEVSDKCYFGCKPGYARYGSPFTVCKDSEKWSHPPPTCAKEPKCPKLVGPLNGESNCKKHAGGTIICKPSCPQGKMFYFVAKMTYVCNNSNWAPSNRVPDCVGALPQESQDCKEGFEYRANISSCIQCPTGWFKPANVSNVSGPHSCLPCPLGSFQERVGSSRCLACPDGWTTSVSGGAHSIDLCSINVEEFSGDVEDLVETSGEENNISGDETSRDTPSPEPT